MKRYKVLGSCLTLGVIACLPLLLGRCALPPPSAPSSQEISGSEVWSQNCSRCHNMRPADDFSDGEWEVLVNHMAWRAQLTYEERRAVTQFLQAGN